MSAINGAYAIQEAFVSMGFCIPIELHAITQYTHPPPFFSSSTGTGRETVMSSTGAAVWEVIVVKESMCMVFGGDGFWSEEVEVKTVDGPKDEFNPDSDVSLESSFILAVIAWKSNERLPTRL
ncbi:hypothetical protein WG66_011969 [Moniliophthora roreri]|uniref:Uncharacterized protein n=1 Tax=Moniliophthora roreri TaxID=221103 RepID=A0A0W0GAV8_MONRR|nr:hypothetical protein WG66_011969 [Moniliophthora roreri]